MNADEEPLDNDYEGPVTPWDWIIGLLGEAVALLWDRSWRWLLTGVVIACMVAAVSYRLS